MNTEHTENENKGAAPSGLNVELERVWCDAHNSALDSAMLAIKDRAQSMRPHAASAAGAFIEELNNLRLSSCREALEILK